MWRRFPPHKTRRSSGRVIPFNVAGSSRGGGMILSHVMMRNPGGRWRRISPSSKVAGSSRRRMGQPVVDDGGRCCTRVVERIPRRLSRPWCSFLGIRRRIGRLHAVFPCLRDFGRRVVRRFGVGLKGFAESPRLLGSTPLGARCVAVSG